MKKRILVLSNHPISQPRYGGTKRIRAMIDQYKSLGYTVKSVGIYTPGVRDFSEDRIGPDDIVIRAKLKKVMFATESYIESNRKIFQQLAKKIAEFNPDIVQVEFPFLYPVVKKLYSENILLKNTKLIYDAHNVEYKLIKHVVQDVSAKVVNDIKKCETSLIAQADLCIACTENDAREIKALGAQEVIIAHNGIEKTRNNKKATQKLKKEYKEKGFLKTAVFVGAPYRPNIQGFLDMLGTKLGYLGYSSRIIVVGGVSAPIADEVNGKDIVEEACFYQRYAGYGFVDEAKLAAIIALADVVLLPITSGSGSNIKTAEALQSRKPILATTMAMRGYERFANLPNVFIEDNPEKFQRKLADLLNNPPRYTLTKEQNEAIDSVLWENSLENLNQVSRIVYA